MKERPILFSTPMVQAILAGNKTMTRRVIKPQGLIRDDGFLCTEALNNSQWRKVEKALPESFGANYFCPYGKPGDRLWVRETWTKYYYSDECGYTHYDQPMIYYLADGIPDFEIVDGDGFIIEDQRIKWSPSIHMPKAAARIWLEVVSVRVERLQEITESDCYKEGIRPESVLEFRNRTGKGTDHIAKADFKNLWDSINAKRGYGWDSNPWVWRVEFKRVTDMQRMGRGS